jgi:hypothetical protein
MKNTAHAAVFLFPPARDFTSPQAENIFPDFYLTV